MQTYQIARTDLEVSRLAYGTWFLGGTWDEQPPTKEDTQRGVELLRLAVDLGITLIDLADIYTRGKSDAVVGTACAETPGLRDRVALQAKCGIMFSDDPQPGDPGRYNFECDHIVRAVEGSLARLGTDRVELLLLHRPDPLVEPAEVAAAFDRLHNAGKVRFFGVSNHTAGQIQLLQKHVRQPLVINQLQLSLQHHYLITDGFLANTTEPTYAGAAGTLDYCRLNEITVQAWSPVARGQLFQSSGDTNTPGTSDVLQRLAEQHNTSPEAVAVAWLLRHPAGIQPILGTMNPDRLRSTVLADSVQLSRSEWYELLAAARGVGVP